MVQKNKMNIENFCLVLKQESPSKSNGWLMEHYVNVEANKVLFYSAGLLASRCKKDSEVLIALQKSLIGDDGDVVPIDREFMGSMNPRRSKQSMMLLLNVYLQPLTIPKVI
jgi:hypothetical protein